MLYFSEYPIVDPSISYKILVRFSPSKHTFMNQKLSNLLPHFILVKVFDYDLETPGWIPTLQWKVTGGPGDSHINSGRLISQGCSHDKIEKEWML